MAEKRSAHRIAVRLRASFRSSQAVIEGWVSDMSRLGLFLQTEYLDTEGSDGTVDLELPDHEPLRLPCKVVRVESEGEGAGMAICFGTLPEELRRPLANFMIETSYQSLR